MPPSEPELTQNVILRTLDWAYEKALTGPPMLDSAWDLAHDYQKSDASPSKQAKSLVRWQNSKAATSGFVTGLGGIITLPVAVPANVSSVLFIQVRMIAAIAIIGGHDVHDDRMKTLVYACLAGNAMTEVLRQAGMELGKKLAFRAIKDGKIARRTFIE